MADFSLLGADPLAACASHTDLAEVPRAEMQSDRAAPGTVEVPGFVNFRSLLGGQGRNGDGGDRGAS
jgi:hypothetical protein